MNIEAQIKSYKRWGWINAVIAVFNLIVYIVSNDPWLINLVCFGLSAGIAVWQFQLAKKLEDA